MPFINYNNKNIYYEIHGNGKPLVILNGIMMSHASWLLFLPELAKDHQVILIDFFDQGKSDRMAESYGQDLQVEVVKAVVDELKLNQISLFGISYGGEIALQFAIKYQSLIDKLLLFNTTSYTNPWLHDIGRSWVSVAQTNDGVAFYHTTIPIIYSPSFYSKNIDWMNARKEFLYRVFDQNFLAGMIRLIESAEGYDVRKELAEIKVETLIVSSEHDFVTPVADQVYLHEKLPNSSYVFIKDCGHASMYEKPNEFISILKGFLTVEKAIKML